MSEQPLSEAFVAVIELCEVKHGPLKGAVWTHEWDEWRVILNGSEADQVGVPRFHCAVERKGMPVGMLSPYTGVFVGAYEDAFIQAVKRAAQT